MTIFSKTLPSEAPVIRTFRDILVQMANSRSPVLQSENPNLPHFVEGFFEGIQLLTPTQRQRLCQTPSLDAPKEGEAGHFLGAIFDKYPSIKAARLRHA